MHRPVCHEDTTFTVGRAVTIWQTLIIRVGEDGACDVEDDDLHDTLDERPFEGAICNNCDATIPLNTLHL